MPRIRGMARTHWPAVAPSCNDVRMTRTVWHGTLPRSAPTRGRPAAERGARHSRGVESRARCVGAVVDLATWRRRRTGSSLSRWHAPSGDGPTAEGYLARLRILLE